MNHNTSKETVTVRPAETDPVIGPAITAITPGLADRWAVYSCFRGDGVLLYVGKSGDIWTRLRNHSEKAWWLDVRGITLDWYGSEEEAAQAERLAIRVGAPRYNRVHIAPKVAAARRARPIRALAEPLFAPASRTSWREGRPAIRRIVTRTMSPGEIGRQLELAGIVVARETISRWLADEIAEGYLVRHAQGWYGPARREEGT